jgi:hypothetical protein
MGSGQIVEAEPKLALAPNVFVPRSYSFEPQTLDELLAATPEQLAECDIARMNLLCATGLPGAEPAQAAIAEPATQPAAPATQPAATQPATQPATTQPTIPDWNTTFFHQGDLSAAFTKLPPMLLGNQTTPAPTITLTHELESAIQESVKQQKGVDPHEKTEWGGVVTQEPDGQFAVRGPNQGSEANLPVSAALPNVDPNRKTIGLFHTHPGVTNFSRQDMDIFIGASVDMGDGKPGYNFMIVTTTDGQNTWMMVALAGTKGGKLASQDVPYHTSMVIGLPTDENMLKGAMEDENTLAKAAKTLNFALYARHTETGPLKLVTPK